MSTRQVPGLGNVTIVESSGGQILDPAGSGAAATASIGGHNIVTIDVPTENEISSFEPSRLEDHHLTYSELKPKSRERLTQKDARFKLNQLARGPLSVEVEEETRIASEIEARLAKKWAEAEAQARKQGYDEGFTQGTAEAKTQFTEKSKPYLKAFEGLIGDFERAGPEIFKANEEFLIHLVYRIASSVVLRELKEDPDYVRRLVVHLLERTGARENIKVFVGQEVYSTAETLKQGLAQTLGQLKNISIELDSTISGRGCRVETDFGEVDARIEVQLENIAKALGSSGEKETGSAG